MSIKPKFVKRALYIPSILMHKVVEIMTGISIPDSAIIGRRLVIEHFGGIIIHGNAVIGDDVIIRQGVTIGNIGNANPSGAPKIGNRVSIGAGAKIIGSLKIGDDVKIGANAVILRDIPSGCTAVGVPARIIRRRT
ncbi:serine O-acetyltransferase [Pleomorphomonas oryzae]|uniref:serine O-acetyltransferase n=1 Tax=Pleomorphomonas oryzae TaxID=261934 RepID=UPI001AEC5B9E|nr:serine acetyltransferase [Pleomorphomonas oryzae]